MRGTKPIVAVLSITLLASCKAKTPTSSEGSATSVAPRDAAPPAPTAATSNEPKASTVMDEAHARALVDEWVDLQNRGDFEGYQQLFAENFSGLRRSGTKEVLFDRGGWLVDRKRMFANPMHVQIEGLNAQVTKEHARVTFVQDWRSEDYRDLGLKELVMKASPEGRLEIVKEHMLSSQRIAIDAPAFGAAPVANESVTVQPSPSAEAEAIHPIGLSFLPVIPSDDNTLYVMLPLLLDDNFVGSPQLVRRHARTSNGPALFHTVEAGEAQAWLGRELRFFGASGERCTAIIDGLGKIAVAFPPFAERERWASATPNELAQMAWPRAKPLAVSARLSRVGTACNDAIWAAPSELPAPRFGTLAPADLERIVRNFEDSDAFIDLETYYDLSVLDTEFGGSREQEERRVGIAPSDRLGPALLRRELEAIRARETGKPPIALLFGDIHGFRVAQMWRLRPDGDEALPFQTCLSHVDDVVASADIDDDGNLDFIYAAASSSAQVKTHGLITAAGEGRYFDFDNVCF